MPVYTLSETFFCELAARVTGRMMKELPAEEALSQMLVFTPAFERSMNILLRGN